MIGQLLGRYRLIEKIGEGGMGIVYRAHDEQLDRDVALKVLPPGILVTETSRKRFRHEALAVAKVNHPNVAMAFDLGHEADVDFLVTEYVPGITLSDVLPHNPQPEKTVLDWGLQLVSGIEAAHSQNIIHRDLKPGNLRLKPDGQLKILDFGLAKLLGSVDVGTTVSTFSLDHSLAGTGTPPYMAPEQVRGETSDQRTDIWATGAVLYEMATGRRAFPQTNSAELNDAIRFEDPVPPTSINSNISPPLENVILKSLDKDPDKRYQTARELHVDLARIVAGNAITESGKYRKAKTGKSNFRDQRVLALFSAAVLLAAALASFVWWPKPTHQSIMAVLPFDTIGQDDATAALGRGLTDTVAAKLVQASDTDRIQVVAPRDLREQGVKTADDARREFGTDLVLEGTLERSGEMIRVNCSLVDSKTRRQVGARSVTVVASDSFGLQDQIVSEVLALLPTQIKPEQRLRMLATHDTQPAAYESYIRGRGYLLDYEKPENIDSAIAEFQHAIKVDPNFAPAYAGLGEAYWIGYQQLNKGKDWLSKASSYCEKALSIASNFAEGHTCIGNVYYETGRYEEAVAQFQRALDLDSNSDTALEGLADAYGKLGNATGAETAYKRAIALRPNYWGVYSWLGAFYYSQARYADAAEMFLKVTERAPGNYRGFSNLSAMYLYQGEYRKAIEAAKRSIELRPNSDAYGNLGAAYVLVGQYSEAISTCQQAVALEENDSLNWGNLGDALYWSVSRRSEAAAAYRRAITLARAKLELNPKNSTLLIYLAEYSAMIDEKGTATATLRQALELGPKDPEVLFRTGIIYNHFGEVEQCLRYLKDAVDGGWPRTVVRDTPDFFTLRKNPEFQKITGVR
jgi:serine/threonine-protein kinase